MDLTKTLTTPKSLPFILLLLILLVNAALAQETLRSSSERQALLRLRSSLGIRAKDWPIKADPCLIWRGIACRNGAVVGINISGFKRTRFGGRNPQFSVDSIANLTSLQSFNASSFALPGQIPDWFGQSLLNLRVLDLSFCFILGAIPWSLGNFTRLETLNLSHNKLSGMIPSTLGELSSLEHLDLSSNSFTGSVPSSFSSLQSLSVLDMSLNYLSDSIPPGIGALSKLQKLNISRNILAGSVPPQLGNLSSLIDLDLSFNLLKDPLPSGLSGMKNLERMVVGNNSLSGELPGGLFKDLNVLEFVDLSHNNFSGVIPDALWFMSSLRFVDVSNNNFTGTLPNAASTVKASTAQFNLSDNKYYGGLTSVIRSFNFIDLSSNYFEGKVSAEAKNSSSATLNCLQNVTGQRTSAECTSFYSSKGLAFDNFGIPNNPSGGAPRSEPARKSHKWTIIIAAIFGGVGLLLLVLLLILLFICLRRKGVARQRGNGVGPIPSEATPEFPGLAINFASLGEQYTYQQLLQGTGDFGDANLIKKGHSGDLYRALLDETPVVVKRVDLNTVRREAYLLELDFLSKYSHPRLVPLLGHCLENEDDKYLVYKYMPNGDLSSSLYRKVNSDDDGLQSLDWITRLKIATGAAEALCYLHHECTPPFVHRDVQASSILLDEKFDVGLGSLSEVCAQEGDIHQNVITRFLRLPQTSEQGSSGSETCTCAYDVYCFGKVLLELVTGKMGMSSSNDASTLKEWLDQMLPYVSINDKELITKIVDPSLIVDEDFLEEVWAMAIVARSCLNPRPSRRPLMRYVLRALENPLKVVRQENIGSARLRTSSSRSSWNAAAVFGSWRNSSDVGPTGIRRSGTFGSKGSGGGNNGHGGEYLASQRRQSSDHDVERQTEE